MIYLRFLLLPFSVLYALGSDIISILYKVKILKTFKAKSSYTICVGNISVGGSGKTSMIEYLARHLQQSYSVGILSKGYKRQTKGTFIVTDQTVQDIGDEVGMLRESLSTYPNIHIAVCDKRRHGIALLEAQKTDIILLDDGFQDHSVQYSLRILLTEFKRPYFKDYVLPMGRLREKRRNAKRTDITVVTKTPYDISNTELSYFKKKLSIKKERHITLFSSIKYTQPKHFLNKKNSILGPKTEIVLFTGLASSYHIKKHLENLCLNVHHLNFKDHKTYTPNDWKYIMQTFDNITTQQKCIITTHKDVVKVKPFITDDTLSLYVQYIDICFHDQEEHTLIDHIHTAL